MNKAIKYGLYPTNEQKIMFAKTFGQIVILYPLQAVFCWLSLSNTYYLNKVRTPKAATVLSVLKKPCCYINNQNFKANGSNIESPAFRYGEYQWKRYGDAEKIRKFKEEKVKERYLWERLRKEVASPKCFVISQID